MLDVEFHSRAPAATSGDRGLWAARVPVASALETVPDGRRSRSRPQWKVSGPLVDGCLDGGRRASPGPAPSAVTPSTTNPNVDSSFSPAWRALGVDCLLSDKSNISTSSGWRNKAHLIATWPPAAWTFPRACGHSAVTPQPIFSIYERSQGGHGGKMPSQLRALPMPRLKTSIWLKTMARETIEVCVTSRHGWPPD